MNPTFIHTTQLAIWIKMFWSIICTWIILYEVYVTWILSKIIWYSRLTWTALYVIMIKRCPKSYVWGIYELTNDLRLIAQAKQTTTKTAILHSYAALTQKNHWTLSLNVRHIFAKVVNTLNDVRYASIYCDSVWRHPGLAPTTAFCYRIHGSDGSSDSPLLSSAQSASKLPFFPLASHKRCFSNNNTY